MMKKILVSQIDKLEGFDIVELIDDETKESIGYFLGSQYRDEICHPSFTKINKARLDEAVQQIDSGDYIIKDIGLDVGKEK